MLYHIESLSPNILNVISVIGDIRTNNEYQLNKQKDDMTYLPKEQFAISCIMFPTLIENSLVYVYDIIIVIRAVISLHHISQTSNALQVF